MGITIRRHFIHSLNCKLVAKNKKKTLISGGLVWLIENFKGSPPLNAAISDAQILSSWSAKTSISQIQWEDRWRVQTLNGGHLLEVILVFMWSCSFCNQNSCHIYVCTNGIHRICSQITIAKYDHHRFVWSLLGIFMEMIKNMENSVDYRSEMTSVQWIIHDFEPENLFLKTS